MLAHKTDLLAQIPAVKIKLGESHFGHGVLFDVVKFELEDSHQQWMEMNVVPFLAFIENVLGYTDTQTGRDDGQWHYKRNVPYA